MSPIGAGFLGAGLTVFMLGVLMTIGIVMGIVRVAKKRPIGRPSSNASSGETELVVCA